MYGRRYNNEILSFEASGGLKEASLVMRDRETDSWWSIISGDAIGGALEGTPLEELPVGEKTTWGVWRERHPRTLVLSVDGVEHDANNPYMRYFTSDGTFRDIESKDDRLPAKESIYSFRVGGAVYAAPHRAIEGGATFAVDGGVVFLYRPRGADLFASTQSFFTSSKEGAPGPLFKQDAGYWIDTVTGAGFEPGNGFTRGDADEDTRGDADEDTGEGPERLTGFDTFWYMWANIHDNVVILQ